MELDQGTAAALSLSVTEQVESDAVSNVDLSPDAIDGFLHLAMAPVSPLDGIAGGCQQLVIEKGERFLDIGGEERL